MRKFVAGIVIALVAYEVGYRVAEIDMMLRRIDDIWNWR